jgi:hypothetical protein
MSAGEKRKPEDPENAEAEADVDKRRKEDPATVLGGTYSGEIKRIYDALVPSAENRRIALMEFVMSKLRAAKEPGKILIKTFDENGWRREEYEELKACLTSGLFKPFVYEEERQGTVGRVGGGFISGCGQKVYLKTTESNVFEDVSVAK